MSSKLRMILSPEALKVKILLTFVLTSPTLACRDLLASLEQKFVTITDLFSRALLFLIKVPRDPKY